MRKLLDALLVEQLFKICGGTSVGLYTPLKVLTVHRLSHSVIFVPNVYNDPFQGSDNLVGIVHLHGAHGSECQSSE